jgi:hypothetical protein
MEEKNGKKETKDIWRIKERSQDEVKSQDQLETYLQVANPGIRIFLAAVLILLGGFLLWAIFGNIEDSIKITLVYKDSAADESLRATAYMSEKDVSLVTNGMKVRTDNNTGVVISISGTPAIFHDEELYPVAIIFNSGSKERDHDGVIILKDFRPIELVFN